MSSRVYYDDEYARAVDQGTFDPRRYDYFFLCEGDSWMDRSGPGQLSLPWALAQSFRGARGKRALFINLARFGHTMRGIADCRDGLLRQWLAKDVPFTFDALLLSAGGNDFIDATLKPAPGKGILRNVHGAPAGLQAQDCYNVDRVSKLVRDQIDPAFEAIHALVRRLQPKLPILVHDYNCPVARPAPALPGSKAWLSRACAKNGIPRRLWQEVTERIFLDVALTVAGWATQDRKGLHVVPTHDVPLVPAGPASKGESGDWLNEIHPNRSGWRKLAACWQEAILAVVDQ